MSLVRKEAHRPVGGRLAHFVSNWERLSTDPWTRETVTGHRIEFSSTPLQYNTPGEVHLGEEKAQALTAEIRALAGKEAIASAPRDGEGFTSPVFLVPKSDGSWRLVFNLKSLNTHVVTRHFKMESVRSVKGLMQEGDWLIKLDLKDAYLSIPVCLSHQQYLKFTWQGQQWKLTSLPFGLSSAPCTFTKLMKPVVSALRKLGTRLVLYLDDMLIMAQSKVQQLASVLKLLVGLGFIVNTKKSVLSPMQEVEFLGFLLNSNHMTVSLPPQKIHSIQRLARKMLGKESTSVRDLASLVGTMVAAHPAVLPAPLHYRKLEMAKISALKRGCTYDSRIAVDHSMRSDLAWWTRHSRSHTVKNDLLK